jgi:lipopolysaccharide export system protein LptA
LRNQQARRYARWAAFAAGLVALIVLGIYAARTIRAIRRHSVVASVPASVQQQMQTFSYSGMEQNRTVFRIRASRYTQYKANAPAVLEDVWITIYGREGDRNDNIHTRECSYEQKTGSIQCKGEVSIDLQPNPSTAGAQKSSLNVVTSNLTFDNRTGEASSPAPVQFTLPQGQGDGVGVSYSTRSAVVRVGRGVHFRMEASERTQDLPVDIHGSSLELRRNEHIAILNGPVEISSGARKLSAQKISIALDNNFHARSVIAQGRPSIRMTRGADTMLASAESFRAALSPAGWISGVSVEGDVRASRDSAQGSLRFSSERAQFSFEPAHNLLEDMTAKGNVVARSEQPGVSQVLKTSALHVNFGPGRKPDERRIQNAETLAPATIDMKSADESTSIRAPKFTAQFGDNGHLAGLMGGTGVEVRRQTGRAALETSTANALNASFGSDGQWTLVEEKGNVQFQQNGQSASASYAKIDRASGQIELTGSPVLSDSLSRTAAQRVTINQKTGQIDAEGAVRSTYSSANQSVNLGAGAAHISGDKLTGSTSSGHVVYSGHARLWQGESVLEANQIAVWREEKKMMASGNVIAVFPQQSGPALKSVSEVGKQGPDLWHLRAPQLTYWNDQSRARLEGGVQASSQQVSIDSRTLDAYFGAVPPGETPPAAHSAGRLTYAIAQDDVVVHQDDFRATAERAEFSAAEGKFVLTGGNPAITDSSANRTSGRSLTFFIASDTILVDSQEGSRTLTKHRVEK